MKIYLGIEEVPLSSRVTQFTKSTKQEPVTKQQNKAGPGSNNYHIVQYSQRYEAKSQSKAHEVLHSSGHNIGKLYWSSFEPD